MKKMLFAFLPAFVLAAIHSCSVDSMAEYDTPLTRAALGTVFEIAEIPPSSGPDISVDITSNTEWRLLWATEFITGCDPVSGYGDAVFNFTVSPLPDSEPRIGELIFLYDDMGTERVYYTSFTQIEEERYFEVYPNWEGVIKDELDLTLTVRSNTTWYIGGGSSWIYNLEPGRGYEGHGDAILSFSVSPNDGPPRQGYLWYSYLVGNGDEWLYEIDFIQQTTGLGPGDYYFEAYLDQDGPIGDDLNATIIISSNTTWWVDYVMDWTYDFEPVSGIGDGSVSFSAYPNYGPSRPGELSFRYDDGGVIKSFHIPIGQLTTTPPPIDPPLDPVFFEISGLPPLFDYVGGNGVISIYTNTEWSVLSVSPNVTVLSTSHIQGYRHEVRLRVSPNPSTEMVEHRVSFRWRDLINNTYEREDAYFIQAGLWGK